MSFVDTPEVAAFGVRFEFESVYYVLGRFHCAKKKSLLDDDYARCESLAGKLLEEKFYALPMRLVLRERL